MGGTQSRSIGKPVDDRGRAVDRGLSPSHRERTVFVVHGRNLAARDAMFAFLRSIDLHPLEWSEARQATGRVTPYIAEILDAALSTAQAIVVLLTPDDLAYLQPAYVTEGDPPHERLPTGQARPNVLFEAGMAMARAQDRTVLVELGRLRPFTDIGGLHVVRLTDSSAARQDLAARLEDAGCAVNRDGRTWHTAGNFDLEALGIPEFSLSDFKSDLVDGVFPDNIPHGRYSLTEVVNFVRDKTNEPHLRARAVKLSFHLRFADTPLLRELLAESTTDIRKAIAESIGEYLYEDSSELLLELTKDQDIGTAKAAVDAAVRLIDKRAGRLDSRNLSEATHNKSWQVRYRAVCAIIRIDDNYAVSSLCRFRSTTYHLARNAIRKYFDRRHSEGRLNADERMQAIALLKHFAQDGESSEATVKKLSRTLGKLADCGPSTSRGESQTSVQSSLPAVPSLTREQVVEARRMFGVEVLSFDASQEYGIKSPYSDYVRLKVTNGSDIVLPCLTVLTKRFASTGRLLGSSRVPSISVADLKPGQSAELDYYPRGHLRGVDRLTVEIESLIPPQGEKFFNELPH
jgi:predicted nucleotide-binding protein